MSLVQTLLCMRKACCFGRKAKTPGTHTHSLACMVSNVIKAVPAVSHRFTSGSQSALCSAFTSASPHFYHHFGVWTLKSTTSIIYYTVFIASDFYFFKIRDTGLSQHWNLSVGEILKKCTCDFIAFSLQWYETNKQTNDSYCCFSVIKVHYRSDW